jgi:hypothetical protein
VLRSVSIAGPTAVAASMVWAPLICRRKMPAEALLVHLRKHAPHLAHSTRASTAGDRPMGTSTPIGGGRAP